MSASFLDHVVAQFETIDGIAARYLGDSSLWPSLVSLNSLRYPYLSSDPRERAGFIVAQTTVRRNYRSVTYQNGLTVTVEDADGIHAGDTFIALDDDLQLTEGQRAMILDWQTDAGPDWNLIPILGMIHATPDGPREDPQVGIAYTPDELAGLPPPPLLVLQYGVTRQWPAGIELTIHEDPLQDRQQVFGPGDIMRIPINAVSANLLGVRPQDWDVLLGIDVAIDRDGLLQYDTNGDLVLVAGIPNLDQALHNRLVSDLGDLPLHPEYGNQLVRQLGRILPETLIVANAYGRQAVLADPRVNQIISSSATQTFDILTVDVTAMVSSAEQLLTVSAILHTGA
jgi:hypothetical protein